jgi:hypothetical protein
MSHLTPDELVDAVDDSLAAERRGHLQQCERCRSAVADLDLVLEVARTLEVPEPSPLFWRHFSRRVGEAIRSEASAPDVLGSGWFRWPVLVPVAVLVLLITSLAMLIPRGPAPASDRASDRPASLTPWDEPIPDDAPWTLVADVMEGLDIDEAERAGFTLMPGAIEQAVATLDPAERRELMRLLEAELARPES